MKPEDQKPRYKFVRANEITLPRGHNIGNKNWFDSHQLPGHIWFMARRRWILLRVLTQ